jgi:NTE family protein
LPSVKLGKTLDMRNAKVKYNLNLGYFDGLRFTDGLLGTNYYIKPFTEDYLINLFESLDIDFFSKMSQLFNLKGNKNTLMIKFLSEAKKILNIYSPYNLIDSFVAILEKILAADKIEKFRIYDILTFISLIEIDYKNIENLYKSSERIVKAIEFLKYYSAHTK